MPRPYRVVIFIAPPALMVEALAENLGRAEHRHKGVQVLVADMLLQAVRLALGQRGENHKMRLVGVGAVAGGVGRAAVQVFHNKLADGVLVVADDQDRLAHLDALQHLVDDQRLDRQTHKGVQRRVQVKHKARRHDHEQVGQKQRRRNVVQVGVFFNDQGDDIGAATGRTYVEKQRRCDGGQRDGKHQIEHGLVGQGSVDGDEFFQQHQLKREQHRGIPRGDGKALAQKDKPDDEQNEVCRRRKGAGRDGRQLGDQCRRTRYAAENKVVGEFKKVDADRHYGDAQRDDCRLFGDFLPFFVHGCADSFL